jgi:hypothetical protein
MNELIESDEEINEGDNDQLSLWDSDEERDRVRTRKDKDAKINNSFTGPYPLDPTDFNHTDKGANNQFSH